MAFAEPVDDRDMKAALIYNFAVFTSWPDIQNDITICTFDDDQENLNPKLLKSRKINERRVNFTSIQHDYELQSCQVIYLEESQKLRDNNLPKLLEKYSVLSVVDTTKNSKHNGIINIQLINRKYHFSINNEAAKRAQLLLSSKLLRLATEVY